MADSGGGGPIAEVGIAAVVLLLMAVPAMVLVFKKLRNEKSDRKKLRRITAVLVVAAVVVLAYDMLCVALGRYMAASLLAVTSLIVIVAAGVSAFSIGFGVGETLKVEDDKLPEQLLGVPFRKTAKIGVAALLVALSIEFALLYLGKGIYIHQMVNHADAIGYALYDYGLLPTPPGPGDESRERVKRAKTTFGAWWKVEEGKPVIEHLIPGIDSTKVAALQGDEELGKLVTSGDAVVKTYWYKVLKCDSQPDPTCFPWDYYQPRIEGLGVAVPAAGRVLRAEMSKSGETGAAAKKSMKPEQVALVIALAAWTQNAVGDHLRWTQRFVGPIQAVTLAAFIMCLFLLGARYSIWDNGEVDSAHETALKRIFASYQLQGQDLAVARQRIQDHLDRIEYGMIDVLVWSLPALGFIGTVVGIGDALGKAGAVVSASDPVARQEAVSTITDLMGVAFDTTLFSLMLSIPLMFVVSMVRGIETRDLLSIEHNAANTPKGNPPGKQAEVQ
jgi:hypothetical protein